MFDMYHDRQYGAIGKIKSPLLFVIVGCEQTIVHPTPIRNPFSLADFPKAL